MQGQVNCAREATVSEIITERIDELTKRAHNLLDVAHDKLSPIARSSSPAPTLAGGKVDVRNREYPPYFNTLDSRCDSLEEALNGLSSLIGRIELP